MSHKQNETKRNDHDRVIDFILSFCAAAAAAIRQASKQ